jgi:hypothetical protein
MLTVEEKVTEFVGQSESLDLAAVAPSGKSVAEDMRNLGRADDRYSPNRVVRKLDLRNWNLKSPENSFHVDPWAVSCENFAGLLAEQTSLLTRRELAGLSRIYRYG